MRNSTKYRTIQDAVIEPTDPGANQKSTRVTSRASSRRPGDVMRVPFDSLRSLRDREGTAP